jgi:hypothetical protein
MAWASMHFAVGMCGGAALMAVPCLILRRGWRHIPIAMTLGGIVAILPDSPRLWREDFTSLPFAATLGSKDFEVWLHSIGDLFFFHQSLDAQPREFALLGMALIVVLYNLCLLGFLWHHKRTARRVRRLKTELHGLRHRNRLASEPPEPPPSSAQRTPPAAGTDPVIGRIGSG